MKKNELNELTTYESSLQYFGRCEQKIHRGWQAAFRECVKKLRSIGCEKRATIVLSEPSVFLGQLMLDVSLADAVIAGIFRKTSHVLSCTCAFCGASGRRRGAAAGFIVLCNCCEGLVILQEELTHVLKQLSLAEPSVVWTEKDMNPLLKAFIDEDCWQSIQCNTCSSENRFITMQVMEKQRRRLEMMKETVSAELKRRSEV